MNRSIKLFFVLSLLLNLLLAGVIWGHICWHASGNWHGITNESAETLPPEKQQLLKAAMQRLEQNTDDLRAQISESRDIAAKLLTAEPFDRSAYLAQMEYIQSLRAQMSGQMATTLVDLAGQFTLKERLILAGLMHRPPPKAITRINNQNPG